MSGEGKKALETIKVIPFYGTDTSKGGLEPREFFTKAEVFAATRGFKKAMLEERIKEEFAFKEDLTEEEQLLVKQDEDAKHFLIMSCRGDAFAIIESQETAFKMYQALKNRYDSKKTKDLVKATTKLEKCFMKHDFDDPYIWILEMERLNREVEKCENGIKRSDEQMQATILSRLPKRRYESVITSLNGKIGVNEFTYEDFVSEIYGHYEMFIEPYKNRFADQTKGKHLALNTVSGKGGWRAFKGKCNKCGKQGHKARDCNNTGENKNANIGKKFTGKCFKCGDMGHMARDCKKVGSTTENGMFVGMSIAGRGMMVHEDHMKKDRATINMNEVAMKNLGDTAIKANKTKDTEENKKNSGTDIEGSPKKNIEEVGVEENTFAKRRKIDEIKEKEQRMSWYDMCATSNEEEEEEEDDDLELDEKNEDSEVEVIEVIDLTRGDVVDLTESDDEEVKEIVRKPEEKYDRNMSNDNEEDEDMMPAQTPTKKNCPQRGLFYETDEEEEDMDQTEFSEEHGQYGNVVGDNFYIYSGSTEVERGTKIIVNETDGRETEDTEEKDMEGTEKMGTLDISDISNEQNYDTKTKEQQVYMAFRAQRETKADFLKRRSEEREGKESWLMDSGATTHVAINSKMMTNIRTAVDGQFVRVGNNATMQATAIGDLTLTQGGTNKTMFLKDVMVVPNFAKNLISVGRLTDHGNAFVTDRTGARLTNEKGDVLNFEKGTDGMFYLFATRIRGENEANNVEESNKKGEETKKKQQKEMDINEAHRKFGHATEKVVREMLKTLDIEPVGQIKTCDGCSRAKATQKRTKKVTAVTADKPAERLFMDTSGPYSETAAGNRYWFKLVDDKTRRSWDFYGARKSQLKNVLKDLMDKLRAAGYTVKFIRCDNAGEHIADLKKMCEGEYGVILEYTAPHTPQHNGVVERMFARDAKRALAMMLSAGWTKTMQSKLWAEATKTAALIGNSISNTRSSIPPDELFYGKPVNIYPNLIEFGRVGYVTNRQGMIGKFKERSTKMVMIGYADNHSRDVYRMYNPLTNKVVETRDVYAWADFTNDANDIRMTMAQMFDPELVHVQESHTPDSHSNEEVPVAEEHTESDVHIIPNHDDEIKSLLDRDDIPKYASGAGRIYDDYTESIYSDEKGYTDSINNESEEIENATNQHVPIVQNNEDNSSSDDESEAKGVSDTSDDEESIVFGKETETREDNEIVNAPKANEPKTTKLDKEMKRLGATPVVIEDDTGTRTRSRARIEQAAFNTMLTSDPGEPKTFKQAVEGRDKDKWVPSAKAEINNFLSRDAWQKYPRKNLDNRRPIPVKWIFKVKEEHDGSKRYKSRIVLKGYVMVPGVDYTESFSPVATDTTVRTAISMALYRQDAKWTVEMIDIEAAFLNAELDSDKPVYAEWPEGMVDLGFITEEERQKYCIKLTRAMYGGVDVPRLFMKTLYKYLTGEMKMSQSEVDPCLYYWKDKQGNAILLAVVHVDDVALIGNKTNIEKFKTELKKRFNISDLGQLKKHLGVWYEWKKDNKGETYVVASMNKLEDEIVSAYQETAGKPVKEAITPGFPGQHLAKNKGDTVKMTEYRSLVGKIMYLMTKLAPDIANPARELAQHLSNPGHEHWKALERLVGHIKMKPYKGLVYRRPKELRPISIVDSDYAKNTDDRKSISSGLHTLGGTLVHWESKTQHVVTLSSTEAEYISLAKGACENKFIMMMLDEIMRNPAEERLIGRVYEDNLGAIYLVKNQHVGARTKHIDVRAHFIRELEDTGYLKVQFVRSEENAADILNKNCPDKLHTKHAQNMRNGTLDCWREDVEDKRLLANDSTGEDVLAVLTDRHPAPESRFCRVYAGTTNGIPLATRTIQNLQYSNNSKSPETKLQSIDDEDGDWTTVNKRERRVKRGVKIISNQDKRSLFGKVGRTDLRQGSN